MAPHLLTLRPLITQSVVAMLKEISVAMRKLLTVLVFLAGLPTYLGDYVAASRQSHPAAKVIHIRIFLRLIQALLLTRWRETSAARWKKGAISPLLRLCIAGNMAYTTIGSAASQKTHLYAISNCILDTSMFSYPALCFLDERRSLLCRNSAMRLINPFTQQIFVLVTE